MHELKQNFSLNLLIKLINFSFIKIYLLFGQQSDAYVLKRRASYFRLYELIAQYDGVNKIHQKFQIIINIIKLP